MNREQFKLQIYHNRYTRGVIVMICKIVLWSIVYALVSTMILSLVTSDIAPYLDGTLPITDVQLSPTTIAACIVIMVLTVVYYWYIIASIRHKIKQNKAIRAAEDAYLTEGAKAAKE